MDRVVAMTRQVANNGKSPATARARASVNGQKMLERVAAGMTITEAAKSVGVSRRHGQDLYQRQLQLAMEQNNDLRQHLIAQDLETLRLLARAHMGLALSGDTQSAKVVLACLDRRAKLLGLDAAVKVEISQGKINDTVDEIVGLLDDASDDELATVLMIESARKIG